MDAGVAPPVLLRASQGLAVAGGASSLWVPDHLINMLPRSLWSTRHNRLAAVIRHADGFLDPVAALGWLAARNRLTRLGLGVAVTDPGRRHPAVVAQAFASLHLLNHGRTVLGIGTGERENNVPFGVDWSAPVGRLEEALGVIRALWDSEGRPVSRDGRWFPLRNAIFDVPLYRGTRPQIWVAAHGPRMLRITGTHGDGWLPAWPQEPGEYGEHLAQVRAAASDAGRDPLAVTAGGWFLTIPGPTRGVVDALLDAPLTRSIALSFSADLWARYGGEHPLGPGFTGLQDLLPHLITEDDALDYGRRVPEGLLRAAILCGTPSEIVDRLACYRDHGLRHPVLVNAAPFVQLGRGAASYPSMVHLLRGVRRL